MYGKPINTIVSKFAEKLKTAREFFVDLTSESAASFNGTENATLGVTGILAMKHGGTGADTAEKARNNISAAPMYIYSTEDLIAGESELATGKLYFVYE